MQNKNDLNKLVRLLYLLTYPDKKELGLKGGEHVVSLVAVMTIWRRFILSLPVPLDTEYLLNLNLNSS